MKAFVKQHPWVSVYPLYALVSPRPSWGIWLQDDVYLTSPQVIRSPPLVHTASDQRLEAVKPEGLESRNKASSKVHRLW